MVPNVLDLVSSFRNCDDREGDFAHFRTRVPWVAPAAYLNIVFKPAPLNVLESVALALVAPPDVIEFLKMQNGAILFSGALNVFGVVSPGQLLNRKDNFGLPPFDIKD